MKVAVVVSAILSVACGAAIYPYPATTVVRTPQFDSAVISSERLGGNFAYSSKEAHAYAAISPVVQNVISPVGVSYSATPIQYPAVYPAYAPSVVASAPVAPVYPGFASFAPVSPFAPVAPIAPIAPFAPIAVEDSPAAPAIEITAAPEAPAFAPAADPSEPAADASSDDTVSIEAA